MRENIIAKIQNIMNVHPRTKEWGTNVAKINWDQMEEMSDEDLLNNFERLVRASCYDSAGRLLGVSV